MAAGGRQVARGREPDIIFAGDGGGWAAGGEWPRARHHLHRRWRRVGGRWRVAASPISSSPAMAAGGRQAVSGREPDIIFIGDGGGWAAGGAWPRARYHLRRRWRRVGGRR